MDAVSGEADGASVDVRGSYRAVAFILADVGGGTESSQGDDAYGVSTLVFDSS